MKKIIALSSIVAAAALLASCATPFAVGTLYTGTTTGLSATGGAGTKTGQACTTSILSVVATGDGSIAAAKADGRITNVTSVDYSANNILGIYGQYCTIVKGN
jgi:hypothetical protein